MTHALALPMPSAVGNLDAYIQAANRFPMLTEAEESSLARRFRDEQDLDAARQLVLSHLRLVVSTANKYLGHGLLQAEQQPVGTDSHLKAVKR